VLTGKTPQITIAANSTNISASTVHPKTRKGHVTAKVLAKRWNIGLETVRKTIDSTTQLAVRDFTHTTGGRRLKPYAYQLRYPRLNVEMYTNTLIGQCKSQSGNRYAQVYATPFHWVTVIPIPLKSDAHLTLNKLFRKVGLPRVIIPDNAKELTEGDFKKKALRAGGAILPVDAYTKNANLAEDAIRELKRAYRRTMIASDKLARSSLGQVSCVSCTCSVPYDGTINQVVGRRGSNDSPHRGHNRHISHLRVWLV
jgi:hypothetical protein